MRKENLPTKKKRGRKKKTEEIMQTIVPPMKVARRK